MIVPAHQPRVRAEWLIAVARVVMAVGALVSAFLAPIPPNPGVIIYLAAWYVFYSLGMLGLVWAPQRFAPGWDIAVHAFDLAAFSVLVTASAGATSPFLTGVSYLLVCGMLRWQLPGVLVTALAILIAYVGADYVAIDVLLLPAFPWNTLAIDAVALVVATTILACLTIYNHRYQFEIARLATWPRTLAQDQRGVLAEIISRSAELVGAPQVLLVWREPDEGVLNLAWRANDDVEWVREVETQVTPLVAPDLAERTFQAADAGNERGRVVVLTGRGFRRSRRRPVEEALRARFNMHAVQSSPLIGELIRGRMFFLDQPRQRLDDLLLSDMVARLAAVRLDSFYILRQLGDSAALKERIRLARDLHDSLLQSQAGAALQLMAARRLLDRDTAGAKRSLDVIQQQLERSELETRSFIKALRPSPTPALSDLLPFPDRLQELRRRLERQWNLKVEVSFDSTADVFASALSDQVYRLVQEGVVNAARHADASVVRIHVSHPMPGALSVKISDDGKGFPFRGTYDLAALGAMNRGPLTLRERVTELNGDLTLTSTTAGSELLITLPLAHA